MIKNERELAVTQDRIAYFLRLLSQLRQTARSGELPLVTSGYRREVERMQKEVLDFLTSGNRRAKEVKSPTRPRDFGSKSRTSRIRHA